MKIPVVVKFIQQHSIKLAQENEICEIWKGTALLEECV